MDLLCGSVSELVQCRAWIFKNEGACHHVIEGLLFRLILFCLNLDKPWFYALGLVIYQNYYYYVSAVKSLDY